jgi:hypothetical protein
VIAPFFGQWRTQLPQYQHLSGKRTTGEIEDPDDAEEQDEAGCHENVD